MRETTAAAWAVLISGAKSISDTKAALFIGISAALFGAVLSVMLAAWQGAMPAVAGALTIVATWLCVRVAVMLVLDMRHTDASRSVIVAAWAAGLLPFAFAILPVLRIAAWALSLWLSSRVLHLSAPHDEASAIMRSLVVFEVEAIILVWLVRNLTVVAVLFGS